MSATGDFKPIEIPLEDVVVGAMKQLRDVDEAKLREHWRQTEGQRLDLRVLHVVGNNGPEYRIVLETVERAVG